MRRFAPWLLLCAALWISPGAQAANPSHGISPFGDLKYGPDFTHFDYVNPNAPKGGTMRLAEMVVFDSLNPFILKGVSAPGIGMVYQSLMSGSLDEPQSLYGVIAQSIEVAPDRSYADFVIRRKARWHDGTPITSDDVVFTLEMFKTKASPALRIYFQPITRAEKLTPRRVRFHFADPNNREAPLIAAGLTVISKAYYQTYEFEKTTLTPPLSSGPYRIKSVDQGRSIIYERVKDYWAENLPSQRGMHNFDTIRYDIYRDETVSIEALKAGQYDFREEYIARNWARAYNIPAVERGELIKEKVPHKIPSGMQAFLFNTRKPQFTDRRVREAIGLAMDFEWSNRTLFYDAYTRSSSFFQNTDFAARGLPEGGELALLDPYRSELPPELFTQPFVIPTTDGSGHARANLVRAQALLEEAGWVMKDGVRVNAKTGEPLTAEFMMRQRTFERVMGVIRKNLRRLGIESSFRLVDDSQYQKRLDNFDFEIISIWWNRGVFFPGNEQIGFWHSSQADGHGSNNLAGVKSPLVDHLLERISTTHTLEELRDAARALDRVLLWNHYVMPHWHIGAWRVLHWDKFGKPKIAPSYGLGLETWWAKEAEKP